MHGTESKAIDIRDWKPPKFIAQKIGKSAKTVVRMVDDGRLEGMIVSGEKRRVIVVNPASATPAVLGRSKHGSMSI